VVPRTTLATLEQVSRSFQRGKVTALCGIDLDVEESASLAILGPSGSGKSTLLHILGAMDRPTSGRVRYQWGEPDGAAARARCRARCIGFVFQSSHLLPNLSAIENVQVPMIGVVHGAARRFDRARGLLGQVGLAGRERHRPQDLSGGERQRVAIARALANSPRMILADEPTGNLDTQTSHAILDLLLEVRAATGAALVVVTHNPEVAARLDRTLTLRDGRVAAPEAPTAP
jgi:ABC-type lipoprotein export system ATPase subunit